MDVFFLFPGHFLSRASCSIDYEPTWLEVPSPLEMQFLRLIDFTEHLFFARVHFRKQKALEKSSPQHAASRPPLPELFLYEGTLGSHDTWLS